MGTHFLDPRTHIRLGAIFIVVAIFKDIGCNLHCHRHVEINPLYNYPNLGSYTSNSYPQTHHQYDSLLARIYF